jgi:branched-chain amino acid transport system permease protein
MTAALLIEQVLNGLQFGVMLFLMAAGLTLVFGVMGLIILAHGSLYMVGAFACAAVAAATGSFLLGLAAALAAAAATGAIVEVTVLRRLYDRDHLDQVLATFALILVFSEGTRWLFGSFPLYLDVPDALTGSVHLPGGITYPAYRLAIIAVGLAVAIGLFLLINRTRLGTRIRAGEAAGSSFRCASSSASAPPAFMRRSRSKMSRAWISARSARAATFCAKAVATS